MTSQNDSNINYKDTVLIFSVPSHQCVKGAVNKTYAAREEIGDL